MEACLEGFSSNTSHGRIHHYQLKEGPFFPNDPTLFIVHRWVSALSFAVRMLQLTCVVQLQLH